MITGSMGALTIPTMAPHTNNVLVKQREGQYWLSHLIESNLIHPAFLLPDSGMPWRLYPTLDRAWES